MAAIAAKEIQSVITLPLRTKLVKLPFGQLNFAHPTEGSELSPQPFFTHRVPHTCPALRFQGALPAAGGHLLQNIPGNQLAQPHNIITALQLKPHLAYPAEKQIQLAVKIKRARRLNRVRLHLAIRQ